MIAGVGMLAFRDPWGIRPLVLGHRTLEEKGGRKKDYIVASESVALGVNDFHLDRDIKAGEAVFIDIKGKLWSKVSKYAQPVAPCLFEYVYLARPDSIIDGVSVYQARTNMGAKLADKIRREWKHMPIDVVIPIPETSRTAALEIAQKLNKPYREGFMKNRYIGRTFIMPGQAQRRNSIRRKLSPIPQEFKDRNVLLVDDSIVRGNTIREIVAMTRELGAKKVYVASTAPPVRFPNVYGIDMPARSELIAAGRTVQQLAEEIGADGVIFQDLRDLEASVKELRPDICNFEASVFDGKYITGDITKKYLNNLQRARNDAARQTEEVATHITRNLAAHL
ncbi:MAG: amidophosphoribosyltransferase, partial [Rhodospirillales bacterium]|nr:amidophosphoribosyltransferase [Acetobacter sp.]